MSFQREKKGLLKLLSNKKKLRPSPPSSPTLEAEQSISMEIPQGAVGPEMAPPSSASVAVGHNGRAVPCPMDSELSVSSSSSNADAASHRSSSQDNTAPIAPPPRQPCSSLLSMQHDGRPIVCERYNNTQKSTFTLLEHCLSSKHRYYYSSRYRVVVSYPPQSEAELELKEGDIVFVHRKREDGWFKGTLQRNGRTGLFPGSFVDSI